MSHRSRSKRGVLDTSLALQQNGVNWHRFFHLSKNHVRKKYNRLIQDRKKWRNDAIIRPKNSQVWVSPKGRYR
jgi:hypothetical protein